MINLLKECGEDLLTDCAKIMSGWGNSHGVYNFTLEYPIKEVISRHLIGIEYPKDGTCPYDAIYNEETISLKTVSLPLNKTKNSKNNIIKPQFDYYHFGGKSLILRNTTESKYENYFGKIVNSLLVIVKDINSNKYGLFYYNSELWKLFYNNSITIETNLNGGDNQWKCNLPAPSSFSTFVYTSFIRDSRHLKLFDQHLKKASKDFVDEILSTEQPVDNNIKKESKSSKTNIINIINELDNQKNSEKFSIEELTEPINRV